MLIIKKVNKMFLTISVRRIFVGVLLGCLLIACFSVASASAMNCETVEIENKKILVCLDDNQEIFIPSVEIKN